LGGSSSSNDSKRRDADGHEDEEMYFTMEKAVVLANATATKAMIKMPADNVFLDSMLFFDGE